MSVGFGWDASGLVSQAVLQGLLDTCDVVHLRPGATYSISGTLLVSSNTLIHGHGATLQRVSGSGHILRNRNYSGSGGDHSIRIREVTIVGTGDQAVSGQAAGMAFWGADNVRLEDIRTRNTNGDGIQWRNSNVTLSRVRIGDFGRNGISPTGGEGSWHDVEVHGDPLPGASPGIPINVENNSAAETTDMVWRYVRAANATFVDFHTPSGGDFAHRVQMIDCAFPGGTGRRGIRVLAPNSDLTARSFIIEPSTTYDDIQIVRVAGITMP